MKRTQIYLDEEMAKVLNTMRREKGITVSELVRRGLRESYATGKDADKVALVRDLTLVWQHTKVPKHIDATVRKLRKGFRLKRKNYYLDDSKVQRVKKIVGARTETEAINAALDLIAFREDILKSLERVEGKGGIDKVL